MLHRAASDRNIPAHVPPPDCRGSRLRYCNVSPRPGHAQDDAALFTRDGFEIFIWCNDTRPLNCNSRRPTHYPLLPPSPTPSHDIQQPTYMSSTDAGQIKVIAGPGGLCESLNFRGTVCEPRAGDTSCIVLGSFPVCSQYGRCGQRGLTRRHRHGLRSFGATDAKD